MNGESFLNITHSDAIALLQSSRHIVMTVKDVGKLPITRSSYEHAQWTDCDSVDSRYVGATFMYALSCRDVYVV